MSKSHKADRGMSWRLEVGEEIVEEEALSLSEPTFEDFGEQNREPQRMEKGINRQNDMAGVMMDELPCLAGTVGIPISSIGGDGEEVAALVAAIAAVGVNALKRFQAEGRIADVDTAIENLRQAVELTPNGHPDKLKNLNNLGISHMMRFDCLGEIADIDTAIKSQLSAVELTPNDYPNKPACLSNLGNSHMMRFERFGEMADIDKAIESQLNAVELTPDGNPSKPGYLTNLGTSHRMQFERLGNITDIDKAIEFQLRAIALTPNGHPDKPACLSNLGDSHLTRFQRLGEMVDIHTAIKTQLSTVELTPNGHPDMPGRLTNLGNSLRTRFQRLGQIADMNKAIESQLTAVELTHNSHPNKPACLNNLGTSHLTRFERLGEMADINKAIQSQLRAVELTPNGHPDKPLYLSNLGSSRLTRFYRLDEKVDIDKAIESQLGAVQLTPDGHPDKPMYFNNLGTSYARQFERLGEVAGIDNAIESHLSAVDLTPNGHPDKPMYLSNLGNSRVRRFEKLDEMVDIDKAIESHLSAVKLTPNGHPGKPMYLNNLGTSHQTRFERLGEMSDIDTAIDSQASSIELTPNGHPDKPMYLNNLGTSQARRFERLSEETDINKAMESQVTAIELTPDGHPNKPMYLNNLGNSHLMRFEQLGEIADIDKAIEIQLKAVQLTPNGHPNRPMYLNNLGNSHMRRFERLHAMADIDNAIANFEQSALSIAGPPIFRFRATRAWISGLQLKENSFNINTPSLQPQHTLINLIPELVWLGAPVHQRFQTIRDVVGSSIHEAVSIAIRAQELELAIEWMEQGRAIVWNQLRRLRSPLDDLQDTHPFLAQEFQDIQRRIEMSFLRRDMQDKFESAPASLEQQAQAHRRDIQKREDLLTTIRGKDGFQSFLRPEQFSVLAEVCRDRLVVLLTVFGEDCDALIILPSRSITHLSLPNVSHEDISDLYTQWESSRATSLRNRGGEKPALPHVDPRPGTQWDDNPPRTLSNRGEGPAHPDMEPLATLLSDLWKKIVYPIVKETEAGRRDSARDQLPRITWCPSGPLSFLPLHAAGIYGSNPQDRIGISDFAVSSYIPSLMALRSNTIPMGPPSILMVTQPHTPNQTLLPGTLREAEMIMQKATLNDMQPRINHLSQSQATVSAVMAQLKSHTWVHLACHGTQKFPNPMESSFALHDGHLTLASLMQNSVGHARFAFLSACQTATGAQTLPDEAMHLTSGMLAAGFPSVVGTIWSIEDRVAPDVAEAFYAALFEIGNKSGWKVKPEPAYALHSALRSLREKTTDRDLMKWVPFVHYGI
ncbi:CHAT domain-containing protein [Flagelloscypha sp. PMI_526]|nr:CHAT domain-containing protein [Flagelloscypha sp. PMI_526]